MKQAKLKSFIKTVAMLVFLYYALVLNTPNILEGRLNNPAFFWAFYLYCTGTILLISSIQNARENIRKTAKDFLQDLKSATTDSPPRAHEASYSHADYLSIAPSVEEVIKERVIYDNPREQTLYLIGLINKESTNLLEQINNCRSSLDISINESNGKIQALTEKTNSYYNQVKNANSENFTWGFLGLLAMSAGSVISLFT
jgi:hypothetical protein